jgi:hypothetical protein
VAFCEAVNAIAALLSVSAAVVFVVLVIGIPKGDRARHLPDGHDTALDTFTRRWQPPQQR